MRRTSFVHDPFGRSLLLGGWRLARRIRRSDGGVSVGNSQRFQRPAWTRWRGCGEVGGRIDRWRSVLKTERRREKKCEVGNTGHGSRRSRVHSGTSRARRGSTVRDVDHALRCEGWKERQRDATRQPSPGGEQQGGRKVHMRQRPTTCAAGRHRNPNYYRRPLSLLEEKEVSLGFN